MRLISIAPLSALIVSLSAVVAHADIPKIRDCAKSDIAINWQAAPLGEKVSFTSYNGKIEAPVKRKISVVKVLKNEVFVDEDIYVNGDLKRAKKGGKTSYFHGFLIAGEDFGWGDYRKNKYNFDVAKIKTLAVGQSIEFTMSETSVLGGAKKTVTGNGAIKLLGCSTIKIADEEISTRVFDVTTIYRSRRTGGIDRMESYTTSYFVSPKHGISIGSYSEGYLTIASSIHR
jgi:hypothetical protein